jgi:hypothetical protein
VTPTAAGVTVGGRLLLADAARGISNAQIVLIDQNGQTRAARTNPFGYFSFRDVSAGQTYIISASHKLYRFTPQVLNVTEEMTDLSLVGRP